MIAVPLPVEGTRRERVVALTAAIAAAFETHPRRRARAVVGRVPPDLAGPRRRSAGARRHQGRAAGRRAAASDRPEPPVTHEPLVRLGRADLHIHTLASDGTVVRAGDPRPRRGAGLPGRHRDRRPRADRRRASPRATWPRTAACASRSSWARRSPRAAATCSRLFLERPVPSLKALALVHRGGPRPGRDRDPRPPARAVPDVRPGLRAPAPAGQRRPGRPPGHHRDVQPHGAGQVPPRRGGPVRGRASACRRSATATPTSPRAIGAGWTTFPGRTPEDYRAGPRVGPDGAPRRLPRLVRPAGRVRAAAAQVRARDGGQRSAARCAATGRAGISATRAAPCVRRATIPPREPRVTAREDRAGLAVRLPAAGRRHPARPVPLREPPPARPRGPDPDLVPRPPALVRGRRHPPGQGLLDAGQRLGRDDHALAALRLPGPRPAGAGAVRRPPLPRAVRAVPLARAPATRARA